MLADSFFVQKMCGIVWKNVEKCPKVRYMWKNCLAKSWVEKKVV